MDAERQWLVQRQAAGIRAMLARHGIAWDGIGQAVSPPPPWKGGPAQILSPAERGKQVKRFVPETDVFSRPSDGTTIAAQYAREGITLRPASMDRINGWAEVMHRLGEPSVGLTPRLFIHRRCGRLIVTLPEMQHDPNRPEDVLKADADADGTGGDDAADCLRYLVATKPRVIVERKLKGIVKNVGSG